MKLGIAAIFKNEKPYIIEWLAFHRLVGFRHFFIADNISDDGSSQLLAELDHAGFITRIEYPTVDGKGPQVPAYNSLIKKYGSTVDWLAFIDADEFILPEGGQTVEEVLAPLTKNHDVGAIGVNWATFGSSGHTSFDQELVTKRFKSRAYEQQGVNKHIKTIIKPAYCERMINPHKALLSSGHYAYPNGNMMMFDKNNKHGMSERICWEGLRINHYVIKSYDEFKTKKQPKGKATSLKQRDDSFFNQHDFNEERCCLISEYTPALEKEIEFIKIKLDRLKKKKNLQKKFYNTVTRPLKLRHWLNPRLSFHMKPNSELKKDGRNSQWQAVGNDPHFNLQPLSYNPKGWYMLSVSVSSTVTKLTGKLYVDYGDGISEHDAILLPMKNGRLLKRVCYFAKRPKRLRFDPVEQPCSFSIDLFSMSKLNSSYARKLMLKKLQARKTTDNHEEQSLADVLDSYNNCFLPCKKTLTYPQWQEKHESVIFNADQIKIEISEFTRTPLISIVMATYNTKPEFLKACLDSVLTQSYPNWELCIADDYSKNDEVKNILNEYSEKDSRIKTVFRSENGHISKASNSALELATGDYVGLLDHDDCLAEHALFFVAKAVNDKPKAKIIYTDEDKIDESGVRFEPHFKTDWNRDLLYSHNYITHFSVFDAELIKDIGGFKTGVEGSQDYDLILRSVARVGNEQIVHIPHILYHWRAIQGSTALSSDEKDYTTEAGLKALKNFFAATHIPVTVKKGRLANTYRVIWPLPKPAPLVSLIIPTRDGYEILKQCVDGILAKTTYKHYEILILNNQTTCPKTLDYFEQISNNANIRVIDYDQEFNYSAINNYGVSQAKGSIIGLINNDIEVINPDWLDEMVRQVSRPDIGCVGAKLYYPDDRIQHAGVILGIGGVAGHAYKYFSDQNPGYFSRLRLVQNFSAVTAAALLIRKSVFEEVNGLEEQHLKVAFNDVDFCLKVREKGYRNLWTPYSRLYHHESVSRGYEDNPEKQARFKGEVEYVKAKWGDKLQKDPFYSPNLTLEHEDFSYNV